MAAGSYCSSSSSLMSSSAAFLLLLLVVVAAADGRQGAPRECRFDGVEVVEEAALLEVQSEGGSVEYYDDTTEQMRCAGVFVIRVRLLPGGLALPRSSNNHALAYILHGGGVLGYAIPGCPSPPPPVHRFTQGDVVAMPAGVARWYYNDGDTPLVALLVFDTTNTFNQLQPSMRKFLVAGGYAKGHRHFGENVLAGFRTERLSEALGVTADVARRLQSHGDARGEIVLADDTQRRRLRLLTTTTTSEPQWRRSSGGHDDGDDVCTMAMRMSLLYQLQPATPAHAHAHDRIQFQSMSMSMTRLNARNFPMLNLIGMSAARVNVHPNAVVAPFWNVNAHSVVYVVEGGGGVEVVDDGGRTVLDAELRRGQLLIVPQNYVVMHKASSQGFQYISMETSPDSMVTRFAPAGGDESSIFGAMPVDVLAASYRLSMEEARDLKKKKKQEQHQHELLHHSYGGYDAAVQVE